LAGKPEGKISLGRSRHKGEDNINVDLREVGCRGMDWIDLAEERDRWRALVYAVMNIRVHKMRGISSLTENRLASQEALCSVEYVRKSLSFRCH